MADWGEVSRTSRAARDAQCAYTLCGRARVLAIQPYRGFRALSSHAARARGESAVRATRLARARQVLAPASLARGFEFLARFARKIKF